MVIYQLLLYLIIIQDSDLSILSITRPPWSKLSIIVCLVPSDEEQARARQISAQQMNKLEELWKESPDATVDDLLRGAVNTDEVAPVALRYQVTISFNSIL